MRRALSWQAASLHLGFFAAVLLAYLMRRRRLPEASTSEVWSKLVLPSQALWAGIPSYFRHPTLPILTFRTERAGLGDPLTMAAIASRFEPRPSDVHIVTYPKAGTSWIQEVAWLVNHDADFERSSRVPSSKRTVYIELDLPGADKLTQLEAAIGPRHIKWHHSADLLPRRVVEEGRFIYLMRNPKDVAVSWYHFQRMNQLYAFTGSFDDFFDHFLEGEVAYGSYWHNVLSWWARRAQSNVLFLTYEEMHLDLPDGGQRQAAPPVAHGPHLSAPDLLLALLSGTEGRPIPGQANFGRAGRCSGRLVPLRTDEAESCDQRGEYAKSAGHRGVHAQRAGWRLAKPLVRRAKSAHGPVDRRAYDRSGSASRIYTGQGAQ